MEDLERVEQLLFKDNINEAIDLLNAIIKSPAKGEEIIKVKELAITKLGQTQAKHEMADDLYSLIEEMKGSVGMFSKAKAAKLIRELVDQFLNMRAIARKGKEIPLCENCISWAKAENRVYLRQALESRLILVYVERQDYNEALKIASTLLRELKKIDDKALLVEVQLLESKAYQKLGNVSKSRASLTSAKTTANGIYCPPKLQASLDLQSGIIHAEEKDFKTSYSYFYEAFENYDSVDDPQAVIALKYMLLCKVMLNQADDVQSIVTGKLALRYTGPELIAMQQIAKASQNRSIAEFKTILKQHNEYIEGDPIVKSHLGALYDTLLEQNLLRIIEPFSRVEVDHVAKLINLPQDAIEQKLSQMILDKTLHGILDQGKGILVVFEDSNVDQTYTKALGTIGQLGKVVDSLYQKAKHVQ
ncbi:PREDICTED: 26S proteasome non-ATPase regulatory subunit 11-like [Amphimedon queenslandica]|uniref:PCI domain-containing protein n=1 Tax=Amphimedon queenslandica TaxID=400682 RepID=A0A1X7VQK5_AMPQE|nr:PREDICTED: 26S proteasome non-ATPase regulatory subunit 11-like [Amphimedon queenslandica]|eukprot:XP_003383208.1 PREDICTED: 26S proteasome non-ATPase regulatory subunit 11-like [Amphimedon queenslandica]